MDAEHDPFSGEGVLTNQRTMRRHPNIVVRYAPFIAVLITILFFVFGYAIIYAAQAP